MLTVIAYRDIFTHLRGAQVLSHGSASPKPGDGLAATSQGIFRVQTPAPDRAQGDLLGGSLPAADRLRPAPPPGQSPPRAQRHAPTDGLPACGPFHSGSCGAARLPSPGAPPPPASQAQAALTGAGTLRERPAATSARPCSGSRRYVTHPPPQAAPAESR